MKTKKQPARKSARPARKSNGNSRSLERLVSLSGVVVERRIVGPKYGVPTDEVDIRVFDKQWRSRASIITLPNFTLRAECTDKIKLSLVVKKRG